MPVKRSCCVAGCDDSTAVTSTGAVPKAEWSKALPLAARFKPQMQELNQTRVGNIVSNDLRFEMTYFGARCMTTRDNLTHLHGHLTKQIAHIMIIIRSSS